MLEDAIDRDLVALHDVEDAVREPGFLQQLRGEDRGGRVLLGRLEDERVPARDRRRPHPHGHHRREVERGDACGDAERLADRVDVDARRGLLRVRALEERREPAHELDHLEPALHLAERVGQDFAVLGREQAREILAVLDEEVVDLEEEIGALRERPRAPVGGGGLRGGDRAVDLLDARERDLAGLLAGRGVVDRARSPRCPLHDLAADPVADRLQLGRHCRVHLAPPSVSSKGNALALCRR